MVSALSHSTSPNGIALARGYGLAYIFIKKSLETLLRITALSTLDPKDGAPVLAVDLDGTLIKADLLEESIFLYLKKTPWGIFNLLRSLLKSRVKLKHFLVSNVDLQVDLLPYNRKVLDRIKTCKEQGHEIVLASASPVGFVQAVADHLQVFDRVIATEDNNLKGIEKLSALKSLYPNSSISYLGDSNSDIPLWKDLGKAYLVNASSLTIKRLEFAQIPYEIIDDSQKLTLKLIRRSFRYHQWRKTFSFYCRFFSRTRIKSIFGKPRSWPLLHSRARPHPFMSSTISSISKLIAGIRKNAKGLLRQAL